MYSKNNIYIINSIDIYYSNHHIGNESECLHTVICDAVAMQINVQQRSVGVQSQSKSRSSSISNVIRIHMKHLPLEENRISYA